MKKRSSARPASSRSEMKGVVKKMAGKLTNDPALEQEGRAEMLGRRKPSEAGTARGRGRKSLNPDPHRRG